ncbi:hypothetical protein MMC07_005927 [Pseudocyphellaria aurata]|nr:hypothetical protein [Pseudocyphellaria aurata]
MAKQSIMSHNAGVKDSLLTIHGNLQAERLGRFFAQAGVRFTNVFSSDLQRAFKTAEAIRSAQGNGKDHKGMTLQEVSKLTVLREQDFGFYEGKPFYTRQRDSRSSGNARYKSQDCDDPDFKDVESTESMTRRMESFIQNHLVQLLNDEDLKAEQIIAIVSHGIILSHLWKCLLKLFPKESVALSPSLSLGVEARPVVLEHLGGWSNTGYLELNISPTSVDAASTESFASAVQRVPQSPSMSLGLRPVSLEMIVKTVNGKEHLKNLKRTRGGVGSSKHDEGQRKIESYFKKQKLGD